MTETIILGKESNDGVKKKDRVHIQYIKILYWFKSIKQFIQLIKVKVYKIPLDCGLCTYQIQNFTYKND